MIGACHLCPGPVAVSAAARGAGALTPDSGPLSPRQRRRRRSRAPRAAESNNRRGDGDHCDLPAHCAVTAASIEGGLVAVASASTARDDASGVAESSRAVTHQKRATAGAIQSVAQHFPTISMRYSDDDSRRTSTPDTHRRRGLEPRNSLRCPRPDMSGDNGQRWLRAARTSTDDLAIAWLAHRAPPAAPPQGWRCPQPPDTGMRRTRFRRTIKKERNAIPPEDG